MHVVRGARRGETMVRPEKGGCALERRAESPGAQETGGVAMPWRSEALKSNGCLLMHGFTSEF